MGGDYCYPTATLQAQATRISGENGVCCLNTVIDVHDLSEELLRVDTAREVGLDLRARVDALEADLLREALVKTHGNQTKAAEMLGLSRFGLQKMMRRLGVPSKPEKLSS